MVLMTNGMKFWMCMENLPENILYIYIYELIDAYCDHEFNFNHIFYRFVCTYLFAIICTAMKDSNIIFI